MAVVFFVAVDIVVAYLWIREGTAGHGPSDFRGQRGLKEVQRSRTWRVFVVENLTKKLWEVAAMGQQASLART
ncbi:hypothetical protein BSZ39_06615 [Bowdeniella nasicola]|uniref:Uncharacterized protein n=1 Tax=Bowdeniella nasicola TaxID=208480 RepID=A0A1Q5Q2A4_9ACTO|nr:hypothetical protein BSZ39_06615 [Bowdeniella nasicola]